MIKQGQNKIFRALIWDKVRLCRPNMTRDMIKKKKQGFSFMLQKCKIWHFLKITVLTFFIISPVIFGLQRCTLSQIKALEILFWPCFIIFSPRINICWAIMSRSCQRFFDSPFRSSTNKVYLAPVLIKIFRSLNYTIWYSKMLIEGRKLFIVKYWKGNLFYCA